MTALRRVGTFMVCLGAQKAGTSWLANELRRSDAVHMHTKEVHYWDTIRPPYVRWDKMRPAAASPPPRQSLRERVAARLGRSPAPGPRGPTAASMFHADPEDHSGYVARVCHGLGASATLVGDMTPSYALCSAATMREMASVHPNVRFVFLVRDPVDRLWSALRHRHLRGREDGGGGPQDWLLRAYDRALADPLDPDHRRSDYAATLAALDAAVPSDRLFLAFYETMFSQDAFDRLAAFLGIAPHPIEAGRRDYVGVPATATLSPERRARGARSFAATYRAVRERVGGALPEGWADPDRVAPITAQGRPGGPAATMRG